MKKLLMTTMLVSAMATLPVLAQAVDQTTTTTQTTGMQSDGMGAGVDGFTPPEGFQQQNTVLTAENLLGANIYGPDGSSFGSVHDLVIDMAGVQSGPVPGQTTGEALGNATESTMSDQVQPVEPVEATAGMAADPSAEGTTETTAGATGMNPGTGTGTGVTATTDTGAAGTGATGTELADTGAAGTGATGAGTGTEMADTGAAGTGAAGTGAAGTEAAGTDTVITGTSTTGAEGGTGTGIGTTGTETAADGMGTGATTGTGTETMAETAPTTTGTGTDLAAGSAGTASSNGGQITHVILDVGGFLGIGAHRTAVPISDLQIYSNEQETRIYLPWTQEQVEALPEYDANDPNTLGRSTL